MDRNLLLLQNNTLKIWHRRYIKKEHLAYNNFKNIFFKLQVILTVIKIMVLGLFYVFAVLCFLRDQEQSIIILIFHRSGIVFVLMKLPSLPFIHFTLVYRLIRQSRVLNLSILLGTVSLCLGALILPRNLLTTSLNNI